MPIRSVPDRDFAPGKTGTQVMELTEIFRFVGALIFIIALIALCAFVAKKLGLATGGMVGAKGGRRLSVSEVKVIDARTRLVLIRRDNREHLILLGGEANLVIESGIEAPAVEASASEASPLPMTEFAKPADQLKKLLSHLQAAAIRTGYMKERRA